MFGDSISIFVGVKPLDTNDERLLYEAFFQHMQARNSGNC